MTRWSKLEGSNRTLTVQQKIGENHTLYSHFPHIFNPTFSKKRLKTLKNTPYLVVAHPRRSICLAAPRVITNTHRFLINDNGTNTKIIISIELWWEYFFPDENQTDSFPDNDSLQRKISSTFSSLRIWNVCLEFDVLEIKTAWFLSVYS